MKLFQFSPAETTEPFAAVLSSLNFVFYSFVTIISGYFFFKFRAVVYSANPQPSSSAFGRFDGSKLIFFLVLFVSSILDIPLSLSCIILGSPRKCEWNGLSYPFLWSLHLLSLNGYAYTVITPFIMWSDIINSKDGKLFFSSFPVDNTKRFFQFLLLLYFLSTLLIFVQLIIYYDVNNEGGFGESDLTSITDCVEPFIIVLIAAGCLWCGLRLQLHVINVGFHVTVQKAVLMKLNLTMAVIVICYLARALSVLKLFTAMPWAYKLAFRQSYFEWLICTRWLPYILCSLLLVNSMHQSGAQLAETMAGKQQRSVGWLLGFC